MTTPAGQYRESVALYRRASAALAGGVSSNFRLGGTPTPLFFDHGRGAELVDVDGNRYVDYAAGMGPTILGHAPEAVRKSSTRWSTEPFRALPAPSSAPTSLAA